MTPAEVLYRTLIATKDRLEKVKITSGTETASLEHFISKLSGNADTLEEKFKRLFTNFQNRRVFSWQKIDRAQLERFYDDNFSDNRQQTIEAAEKYMRHEFDIFGQSLKFPDGIDWHYDPLFDKSVPLIYWRDINYYSPDTVKEVKYIWELNRCQHFVTLGKAYFLTADEQYAKALLRQWMDWIDKNPYKMGIYWTSSRECAFRLLSWTWALYFVQKSGCLNPGLYARCLQAIHQQATYIEGHLSRYSSANNHLLGEALGLIYAGSYYSEFVESSRWRTNGYRLFFWEFLSQVHKDGVSKEQTTYYQRYVFDFAVLALLAAEYAHVDVPWSIKDRLEKMAGFYAAIINKSGKIPHIGDDDGGRALRLVEGRGHPYRCLLSTAAVLFKRPEFQTLAEKLSEATFWLLGHNDIPRFEPSGADKELRRIQYFKYGGYVLITARTPLEQKMVFDCGPLGYAKMAAHGHADALSLTFSVDGRDVLIDCGTFMYLGAGGDRDYFRSTRAHNTITIDGLDQSRMLGPFQWGARASCLLERIDEQPDFVSAQASHDGYRSLNVQHRRRVELQQDLWHIKDFISGIGYHQIDAYFHLAPCQLMQRQKTIAEFDTFSVEFQFEKKFFTEGNLQIEKAWHSNSFGQREQHTVLRRRIAGPLPIEFVTILRVYD